MNQVIYDLFCERERGQRSGTISNKERGIEANMKDLGGKA
jgi:hypothetical protein